MKKDGYQQAVEIMQQATTTAGILASATKITNYRRIWARDSIICSLAALVSEDDRLIEGAHATIRTLAEFQGAQGQIPTNVSKDEDGNVSSIDYGRLSGHVDNIPWFVIGACNYIHKTGDDKLAHELAPVMKKALDLLTCWEYNMKGLVYVPQAGDWADELVFHGYVLYDQILRLWALRCHAAVMNSAESARKAEEVTELIQINYWPIVENKGSGKIYHPRAYDFFLETHGEPVHWLMSLTSGGYRNQFDTMSNAFSIMLGIGNPQQRHSVLEYGQSIARSHPSKLLPSFWPPVMENDSDWLTLELNYEYKFSNAPYQYQNGGVWPMISGWWGIALCKSGRQTEAQELLSALNAFNFLGLNDEEWGFYEYGHGQTGVPGGTYRITWSAAAVLLIQHALEGRSLFYG